MRTSAWPRWIESSSSASKISTTLAGSHEYAAMAKLHGFAQEGRYELIVLDTPPTANALDFLDSPEKLADAIDSPAIQWLIKPYLEAGHFSLKLVGMSGAFVLKRLAKFVGSEFLEPPRVLGGLRGPRRDDVVGHREGRTERVQEGARPLRVTVHPPTAAGDSRVAARGVRVTLLDDQNARSRLVRAESRSRTRRPRSDDDHIEFLIETRNAHVRPYRLM